MLNRLPPLNAIKAFHAASRHLNFSRAAEELGVTQGAVSKQILALEDYIGAKLFERSNTGLELTLEGKALKNVTIPAFELLASGFSRFERRPPRSQRIRIATLASFASQFLAPRLDRLESAFPEIELEILTSDRLLDLSREEIDFSIRYGVGEARDLICDPIGSADLLPVCHPETQMSSESLRRIQVFTINEWSTFERLRGDRLIKGGHTIMVEEFLVAISAVLSGQGLAILPELIVRDHIREGRLKVFDAPIENWAYQYYVAMLPKAANHRDVTAIIDWIKQEIRELPPLQGPEKCS